MSRAYFLLRFVAVIYVSLAWAHASPASVTKFSELTESRIMRVTLTLMPEGIRTPYRLSEKEVVKSGCNLSSSFNLENNAKILSILKNHVTFKSEGVGQIRLRNIVTLHLDDGTNLKFSFSDSQNPNNEVYGGLDVGESGSFAPLVSTKSLLSDLRNWTAELQEKETVGNLEPIKCLEN